MTDRETYNNIKSTLCSAGTKLDSRLHYSNLNAISSEINSNRKDVKMISIDLYLELHAEISYNLLCVVRDYTRIINLIRVVQVILCICAGLSLRSSDLILIQIAFNCLCISLLLTSFGEEEVYKAKSGLIEHNKKFY